MTAPVKEPIFIVTDLLARLPHMTIGPIGFCLYAGENLGVMGRSGSGKSTLMRMLSLFIEPDSGVIETPEVRLDYNSRGNSVRGKTLCRYRRSAVYVGQQNSLWPHLSVRENIAFGLSRKPGVRPEQAVRRTDELLDALDLMHVADNRTWQISGGEARRVAVARGLAMEPRVILLDEPETGLDPVRAKHQITLISDTCRRVGASAIIVSHNPLTTLRATSFAMVLKDGRIVESGPTADMLRSPNNSETRELVTASGILAEQTRCV